MKTVTEKDVVLMLLDYVAEHDMEESLKSQIIRLSASILKSAAERIEIKIRSNTSTKFVSANLSDTVENIKYWYADDDDIVMINGSFVTDYGKTLRDLGCKDYCVVGLVKKSANV